MPGYIKLSSKNTTIKIHSPTTRTLPERFNRKGKDAHKTLPRYDFPKLDKYGIKFIQNVVGRIIYYELSIEMTGLMSLSTISSKQTKLIVSTEVKIEKSLDYLATNPDATIIYHASYMLLNIHPD